MCLCCEYPSCLMGKGDILAPCHGSNVARKQNKIVTTDRTGLWIVSTTFDVDLNKSVGGGVRLKRPYKAKDWHI